MIWMRIWRHPYFLFTIVVIIWNPSRQCFLFLWYISEQNICTRICSAKSDWLHSVKHPTVSDFIAQRKDIEDTLQPILSKLSAQCEYFCCTTIRFQNSFWNTKKNHMKYHSLVCDCRCISSMWTVVAGERRDLWKCFYCSPTQNIYHISYILSSISFTVSIQFKLAFACLCFVTNGSSYCSSWDACQTIRKSLKSM